MCWLTRKEFVLLGASAKVDALLSMVSLPGSAGNCGCACWGDVERSYDGAIADEFCYRGMR